MNIPPGEESKLLQRNKFWENWRETELQGLSANFVSCIEEGYWPFVGLKQPLVLLLGKENNKAKYEIFREGLPSQALIQSAQEKRSCQMPIFW